MTGQGKRLGVCLGRYRSWPLSANMPRSWLQSLHWPEEPEEEDEELTQQAVGRQSSILSAAVSTLMINSGGAPQQARPGPGS